MNKPFRIAIIGGGASGMTAAIFALRQGAQVTILERQDRVGRKLLATGNGRCNLGNTDSSAAHWHGDDPDFAPAVLHQFPIESMIAFFETLGIVTMIDDGRIYPRTGQASAVLDVLRAELSRLGGDIRCETTVHSIILDGDSFVIHWSDGEITADRVIIAAGGVAGTHLGGTRDGMALLEKLGHRVKPVCPALVQVQTSSPFNVQIKGVRAYARAAVVIDGKEVSADTGEVQFTGSGVSGIPVMQVSLHANRGVQGKNKVTVILDFFPDWSPEHLAQNLRARCRQRPDVPIDALLVGLVHKRLIPPILKECGVGDQKQQACDTPVETMARICGFLKCWPFAVTGTSPWKEAQVMAGGVDTKEFDARTLESRIVKGIFAAGEVLDVTGDCGGYNLMWAWASGFVAGVNAAKG